MQTDRQLFVTHSGGRLILCLSVHVDDLKMTGEEDQMNQVLKVLTEHFDEHKVEKDNFEHLGLRHVLEPNGSRSVSQEHYVNELRFIVIAETGSPQDEPVNGDLKSQFMSLLGGIAWTVQTRPDIAVFTAALQRKLQSQTGRDVAKLNRVLAYLKRKPMKLYYHES